MGSWRKVYVDDFLPIDTQNIILLPSLQESKPKEQANEDNTNVSEKGAKAKSKKASPTRKETLQLWPMLLCKALLKIASLSPQDSYGNYKDFNIINCLTAWIPQAIPQAIPLKRVPHEEIWEMLQAYVKHFEWPETKEGGSKKPKSPNQEIKVKATKKGSKGVIPSGIENMRDGEKYMMLSCYGNDMIWRDDINNEPALTQWFLHEVRDIPLVKPPPRPDIEFWKTFRYEQWAVEQGIISPDVKKLNIRSLKVVGPFRRGKSTEGKLEDTQLENLENIDKKSEKSSKSSKKTAKSKTTQLEPDPSMWVDFDDIKDYIHHLTIYFQPRCFKNRTNISDVHFPNKVADFLYVISPFATRESCGEPLYIFMDSIDSKILLINLAQVGETSVLQKSENESEEEVVERKSDDLDICDKIVLWKTKKIPSKSSQGVKQTSPQIGIEGKPIGLVLEEYFWDSNTIAPPKGVLSSFGTKSLMLDLMPGRISLRLWISSHRSYTVQFFSDTQASIGCLEEYLAASSAESQLLTSLCYQLSSAFGKLVQSFGTSNVVVNLRNFYQTYKPKKSLTKAEAVVVHKIFFEEFCKTIEENSTTSKPLNAIRLLFLQLKTFDYVNPYLEEPHLYPDKFELAEEVDYAKVMQRAAVRIQAFFKGVYVRLLLKKIEEGHIEFQSTFGILKSVYVEIFSSDKRLNFCPQLLRRFFERQEMVNMRNKFEVHQDTSSVLNNQIFFGSQFVYFNSWVPLCRYEFFINSEEPVTLKLSLITNVKSYSVRTFNNDTLAEVKKVLNQVTVERYERNQKGYTVLCYGWSGIQPKVCWKLVVSSKVMSKGDLVVVPVPLLTTLSLKDFYQPNYNNIICRYIIDVEADGFLTANITTSFDEVQISLALLDKSGRKIQEVSGVKSALFPLLELRNELYVPVSEASRKVFEVIQGAQMHSNASSTSEITYSKLTTKYASTRNFKKSSTSLGSNLEVDKRQKRKSSGSQDDIAEEKSLSSQKSVLESDTKLQSRRKSSSKGSLGPKIRSSSKTVTSISETNVSNYAEYILEAKVVGKSWPLTASEWDRVKKVKEKQYFFPTAENFISPALRMSKRQSSAKKSTMIALMEEPYWILDLVFTSSSGLEFKPDKTASEKRKQIKAKWFSNQERYMKALELREKYLSSNSVLKEDFTIDPIQRSNDSRDFWPKKIGMESLLEYMLVPPDEVDEDNCKMKCGDDYIIEEANLERKMKEYEEDEDATNEEIDCLIQEQKEHFEVASQWFQDLRDDSTFMIGEVLAERQDYVNKILAKPKTKSEKKRKEKKK